MLKFPETVAVIALEAVQLWVLKAADFATVIVPDTVKLSANEVVELLSFADVSVRLLNVFPAVVTVGETPVCVNVTVYVLGVNVIPEIRVSAP